MCKVHGSAQHFLPQANNNNNNKLQSYTRTQTPYLILPFYTFMLFCPFFTHVCMCVLVFFCINGRFPRP